MGEGNFGKVLFVNPTDEVRSLQLALFAVLVVPTSVAQRRKVDFRHSLLQARKRFKLPEFAALKVQFKRDMAKNKKELQVSGSAKAALGRY